MHHGASDELTCCYNWSQRWMVVAKVLGGACPVAQNVLDYR